MLHVTSMRGFSRPRPVRWSRADLHDQVYASLKEALATRKLAPGEKLSLQELAAAYGVSRSPVQQALTRLVSEGLVEVEAAPRALRQAADRGVGLRGLRRARGARALGRRAHGRPGRPGRARRAAPPDGANARDARAAAASSTTRASSRRTSAFHDFQVGLAGNELLRESYRRLSVNA